MRALLVSLCLCVAVAPGRAAAQADCAEGRTRTEQTAGRCCWPGQRFIEPTGRCEGPPDCPAPLVAHGDACVGRARVASAAELVDRAPGLVERSTVEGLGAPRVPAAALNTTPLQTRTEQVPLTGLYITGIVSLALSYTYSVVVGAVVASATCCGNDEAWTSAIPVAGGLVWWLAELEAFPSGILGPPGSIAQVLSLVMLLAGALGTRDVVRLDGEVRLAPGPGEAGAAIAWDF